MSKNNFKMSKNVIKNIEKIFKKASRNILHDKK